MSRQSESTALERLVTNRLPVLIYARQSKSDLDRDGNARGPSIAMQVASVERLAMLAGCPREVFIDADRSGSETSKRTGYQAMVARIEAGGVGAVYAYAQDRLHRKVVELYKLMDLCEQHGVLVFDAGGLIRADDDLSWGVKAVVAQSERTRGARRTRHSLQELIRQGRLLGHAPLGYRAEGKGHDRRLVADEVAAPVVREIFALYATGRFSIVSLARHLNQQGVAVPENKDYPKARRTWSADLLKGLLQNAAYVGEVRVDGELRAANHEAIIGEDLFARCQEVRLGNRRRKTVYRHVRNVYSLLGLLRCSRCGSRFHGRRSGKLRRTWYICASRRTAHPCGLPQLDASMLEQALRQDLAYVAAGTIDARATQRLRAGLAKAPDLRKIYAATEQALQARRDRVLFMFEHGDIDNIGYRERLAKITTEQQAAKAQLRDAPKADLARQAAELQSLVSLWDAADPVQRGQMVSEIFEQLDVDRDGGAVLLVAVPKAPWMAFFERVTTDAKPGNQMAQSSPHPSLGV